MNSSDLFGLCIIISTAIAIWAIVSDVETTKAATQAGLQQCVVENRTVWQKECK